MDRHGQSVIDLLQKVYSLQYLLALERSAENETVPSTLGSSISSQNRNSAELNTSVEAQNAESRRIREVQNNPTCLGGCLNIYELFMILFMIVGWIKNALSVL